MVMINNTKTEFLIIQWYPSPAYKKYPLILLLLVILSLKEQLLSLRILKSLASIFQIRRFQSVLIFSILSHTSSFMVYHYVSGVFLSYYLLFSGFLPFKGNFVRGQNNSKYRD